MNYSKIGNHLKLVRERKGLSYEQIFEVTRIQPSILKDIEEGKSPVADVFLKGFIKTYSRALGLSYQELARQEEAQEKEIIKKTVKQDQAVPSKYLKYLIPLAGFVIVFQLIVFLNIPNKRSRHSEVKAEKKIQSQNKNEKANWLLKKDSLKTESHTQAKGRQTEIIPSQVKQKGFEKQEETLSKKIVEQDEAFFYRIKHTVFKHEILIKSSEPLNIYFKADGSSTVTQTLEPFIWFHIKAQKNIYLRFDDRKGETQIFYNGEQVNLGDQAFFEKIFK